MTVLLYLKDYMRGKLGADELILMFDEDNQTNEEEVLEQPLIDQVYLKVLRSPKFGDSGIHVKKEI